MLCVISPKWPPVRAPPPPDWTVTLPKVPALATSLPPLSMVTSPVKVPPVTVTVSEMVTAPRKLPLETEEPSCMATAP